MSIINAKDQKNVTCPNNAEFFKLPHFDTTYFSIVKKQYDHILQYMKNYNWDSVNHPCVVMDIDETVVCNIPGAKYNNKSMYGCSLPGALQLTNFLKTMNIPIYFVSARSHKHLKDTGLQMAHLGFFPRLIFHQNRTKMPSYEQYKHVVRKRISEKHTIVACIGDQEKDINSFCECGFLIYNPFYKV